tara:strand:- start:52 stop:528 length:477 start_codon:yes stop_codon:yes gene_type:complete
MIITCENCNKKFDVDQNLIPTTGRLLQCNSCNHKWFFKNEIVAKTIEPPTNHEMEIFESKKPQENNSIDVNNDPNIQNKTTLPVDEIVKNIKINNIKSQKKNNLLNLTIVFIISFVALVLLADTFKQPLIKIVPNLEFLLYNLYESIQDIILFIKDLI